MFLPIALSRPSHVALAAMMSLLDPPSSRLPPCHEHICLCLCLLYVSCSCCACFLLRCTRSTSCFLLSLSFVFEPCRLFLDLGNSTLRLLVLRHKISLGVPAKPDREFREFLLQSLDGLHVHVRLGDEFGHVHCRNVSIS